MAGELVVRYREVACWREVESGYERRGRGGEESGSGEEERRRSTTTRRSEREWRSKEPQRAARR